MAVPTNAELHQFIGELIEHHQPDGEFAVFEYEFLIDQAWRHFKTTSAAVRPRLKSLVEEGSIKPVSISHTGHVYPDKDLALGLFTLYFAYRNPSGYAHAKEEYGLVTAKRPEKHDNVWRSGYQDLYTTAAQHDAMITHFQELKAERAAKAKAKDEQETAQLWELLEAASPGARQVLDELDRRLHGGEYLSEVRASLTERRKTGHTVWLEIAARTTEHSVTLIDIIRRGLAAE